MNQKPTDFQAPLDDLPVYLSERTRLGSGGRPGHMGNRVLYWTHHALRSDENPALDVAIHLAHRLQLPLLVYQGLSEKYRFASDRHHTFILEAARDLQESYAKLGISFAFHLDRCYAKPPRLARLVLSSAVVVTEDFPLEATKQWTGQLVASKSVPVVLVDTACVVPMRLVGKAYDRAFAFRDATASLYRSRVDRDWPTSTTSVELETKLPFESLTLADHSLAKLVSECDIDHSVGPVSDTRGGSVEGYARWQAFRKNGLRSYAKRRNQIEIDGVSRMSAYLHYGMVSPFRLARESSVDKAEKFLDELLIWRELAYSFCYFRKDLESNSSLPAWAISTLTEHERDSRTVLSWETLARARTGERLWDAAQRSLLKHGELHNNVRMTWGKAILEWSREHRQALERLVDLNHRYALDGRDPASYGGILWCLETWVLHSTVDWAKENLETTKEQVVQLLIEEVERVTGSVIPKQCSAKAHRWLYSRPAHSLTESSLWDDSNWLGACGDWCGGPRVEGAFKSGVSLAGRVLGTLHENEITATRPMKPRQLSLFNEIKE